MAALALIQGRQKGFGQVTIWRQPFCGLVSPAEYTAILRAKTGNGIAVVEIYNLN